MQLKIHSIQLPLKRPFSIAYGTFTHRDTVIVELNDGHYSGFGEATVITYYGKTLADFLAILEKYQERVEAMEWETPIEFWQQLNLFLEDEPFVLCALDVAAHDLWSKRLNKPLYQAWGLDITNLPLSNFTISLGTIEEMLAQMEAFPNPIYKIKLGTKEDIAIVKALRKQSNAVFRVDANGAWTVAETLKNAIALKKLGVEFIEQPLPKEAFEEMELVYQKSVLPIIADESCQVASDVEKCHNRFHGINIKLMKCGGFIPALQMIQQAKSFNMSVMCGCMTESSIGISAIAHLLPLLDYVDMDGALLLKEDPAKGVKLIDGKVYFSKENGIGASLLSS